MVYRGRLRVQVRGPAAPLRSRQENRWAGSARSSLARPQSCDRPNRAAPRWARCPSGYACVLTLPGNGRDDRRRDLAIAATHHAISSWSGLGEGVRSGWAGAPANAAPTGVAWVGAAPTDTPRMTVAPTNTPRVDAARADMAPTGAARTGAAPGDELRRRALLFPNLAGMCLAEALEPHTGSIPVPEPLPLDRRTVRVDLTASGLPHRQLAVPRTREKPNYSARRRMLDCYF